MVFVKQFVVRPAIRAVVQRESPTLVVASLGRSGSTLLSDVLAKHMVRLSLWRQMPRVYRQFSPFYARYEQMPFRPGFVYKTHEGPPSSSEIERARYIFTFSDPHAIVRSLFYLRDSGEEDENWLRDHFYHLKANYKPLEELLHSDGLGLNALMKSWLEIRHPNVLCLSLSDFWTHQKAIEEFVGFPLTIPPKRERRQRTNSIQFGKVPEYEEMKKWIAEWNFESWRNGNWRPA